MAEQQYDEKTGAPVREFPVKLTRGDEVVFADTESTVVQREWEGFTAEDGAKALAAAEKATAAAAKQAEKDAAKQQ